MGLRSSLQLALFCPAESISHTPPAVYRPATRSGQEATEIQQGDCLEVMQGLADNSIDLILTDPPYFRVKGEPWDRQWDKPAAFLAWLDKVLEQFQRVLKPNGSLYLFASPQMAARVEVLISDRFNVLNRIRWVKEAGWHNKAEKEALRSYLSPWEEIIFAEHYGADNIAKGEAGYAAKCDELRGFVFEPIRLYLRGEFERAGIKTERANAYCGTASMAKHYFTRSQWCLPTRVYYEALQRGLNAEGRRPAPPYEEFHEAPRSSFERVPHINLEYLRADYEDLRADYEYLRADYEDLRADYEDLRADYEDLRRPFRVTADVPYTDVWDFATVKPYPGKHPCEKPIPLLRHIVRASGSRGGVVLDPFAGSGTTGLAAQLEGMNSILIEQEPAYVEIIKQRLGMEDVA